MSRFLINKKGVYYLTTGKLLRYDAREARTPEHAADVAHVEAEFARIRDLPHTYYEAVEITDSSFSPLNTGQES